MYRWLDGAGKALKSPGPDGPRYLGARGPRGRGRQTQKVEEENDEDEELDEDEDDGTSRSRGGGSRRQSEKDMIPFPTNPHFRSEPVLSEELKDRIWHRVTIDKDSVRRVSTDLHVEMRRVGAVVRLKSLEKQWEEQVRSFPCMGVPAALDENNSDFD